MARSALIAVLGLTPNLERIMASAQEGSEFWGELPFLLMLSIAGGFGALLLGMVIAVIGGWLIKRRN